MCGIVGVAGFHRPGLIGAMCQSFVHRGPDDSGLTEFPEERLGVGVRRLSIIDIEGGHQPIETADGRVTLVFNGEIYNYRELRAELEALGRRFATRSDTEVILIAYLEWGRDAWQRLNGMFTAAIIDRRDRVPTLRVVRDRFGIKPLYYHFADGRLLFASELKALLCWEELPRDINLSAIWNYLLLRYVPGPDTLFQSVLKLPAGHEMEFAGNALELRQWWQPPAVSGGLDPIGRSEAVQIYGDALRLSVRRHMISDVPVGVYLSGGIDSTVIAALAAAESSQPIRTFSVGFPDFADNELGQAEETARHLGAEHTSIMCTPDDLAYLPDIVWALDEPFGDAIVLPMYVLAREARKSVKVVLSGEGADEVLGGYLYHRHLVALARIRGLMPDLFWPFAADILRRLPASIVGRFFDYPGALGTLGRDKLAHFLADSRGRELCDLNRRLITLFDPADVRSLSRFGGLKNFDADRITVDDGPEEAEASDLQRLIGLQFRDWLPDQILMKYDKMTMAHSLEGRVPFMDDGVFAAAARVPDRLKLTRHTNKLVLREFAKTFLPPQLLDRRKVAFYAPLESYAQSRHFRDLQGAMLDPARLKRRGLFSPEKVSQLFDAPASDGFLALKRGFSMMMLELWFEKFCPDASWA